MHKTNLHGRSDDLEKDKQLHDKKGNFSFFARDTAFKNSSWLLAI